MGKVNGGFGEGSAMTPDDRAKLNRSARQMSQISDFWSRPRSIERDAIRIDN